MQNLSYLIITILIVSFVSNTTSAQNSNNGILLSNQAVLFGDQQGVDDPITGIMPGTAYAAGFGSFMDNPASAALFDQNFAVFGLSFTNVDENTSFLGRSGSISDQQLNISDIGLVYSFPTTRGSFVIGGGYSQQSVFNRSTNFNARNENHSITDQFKIPGSPYADIAFNTFATDFGDDVEDWDESIFRVGFDQFGEFFGVRQQGEIIQTGQSGEFSFFAATEFQKDLMLGVSLGLLTGSFNYNRIFQEIDEFDDYNSDFIDTNDDGVGNTDVDNILLTDNISSDFTAFRARIGALYKLLPVLSIGGSHTFRTSISVDEDFDAVIRTRFDNGDEFEDDTRTEFSYDVTYPSRTAIGLSVNQLMGVSVSLSSEYVNYASTRLDFPNEFFEEQQIENDFIERDFRSAWNFRGGVQYDVNPMFTVRGGYSFLPSRFENGNDDKNAFTFGAGFKINRTTTLDIGARYTEWKENSAIFEFGQLDYSTLPESAPPVSLQSEDAVRSVDRWNVMATVRFLLN